MTSKQVLMGACQLPYRLGERFYRPFAFTTDYFSSIQEPDIRHYISVPGAISGLSLQLNTTPGAGKSWTVTLRKNDVDTALSVTITGSENNKSVDGTVNVAIGDYLTIKITPAGSPSNTPIKWSSDFYPTTDGSMLIMTNNKYSASQTETRYSFPAGTEVGASWVTAGSEATRRFVMPCDGRLKSWVMHVNNAPLAGASNVFTVMKNGVATTLSITISDSAKDGSDLVNYVDFVKGDEFNVRFVPINIPNPFTSESWSFEFVPTTSYEIPVFASGPLSNIIGSVVNYTPLTQAGSWSGVEAQRDVIARATRFTRIYAKVTSAPGVGKTWYFRLRKNGVDTSLNVVIAGTDTYGYADVNVDVAAFDKLIVRGGSSGSPSNTTAEVALVQYYEPITNASADLSAHFLIPRDAANLQSGFMIRQVAAANLQAGFQVGQDSEDLLAAVILRHTSVDDIRAEFMLRRSATADLKSLLNVQQYKDLWAHFNVHKTYDFSGSLGIGFYWWGSEVIEGDQIVDFQMLTPTGGWVAKFPDGDAEWRWVLLPFEDRDPTSLQRLIEVDLGGDHADKSNVESLLWTYHSTGIRRIASINIWYGGDLKGVFYITHNVSQDLKATFIVPLSRVDLIAEEELTGVETSVVFDTLDILTHKFYRLIASVENADPTFAANIFAYINDDEDRTHYNTALSALMAPPITALVETMNSPHIADVAINERGAIDILFTLSPSGYVIFLGEYSTPVTGYGYTTDIPRSISGQSTFTVANLTKIKLVAMKDNTTVGVGFKIGSKFQLYGYKAV